ncbi:kinase [Hirsutella rhossiliensis]|uniref:non-specific serine/threonine protein kinase n=1 Tax=Hirsutella rhossiliensis TaxID=111463 RepID=A0A9P8SEK4_9HYPO|nr:kinase [Hirsutella rhossiliensis]KAH0959928.1 kinase [Hirsutella rhossiliensis]
MGDQKAHGRTTVGNAVPGQRQGRAWQDEHERKDCEAMTVWDRDEHERKEREAVAACDRDEHERKERETMAAWDRDELWPAINKPLFSGSDAKRFDGRLDKLEVLAIGAFSRVDMVQYGAVHLARKRIVRRRGLTIEDLRQEGLTMSKLDHHHVVKLVATYAPRAHELCLLIWPAAVCNLSVLLDDIEDLRLGETKGDRNDIADRLHALCLLSSDDEEANPDTSSRPFDFLCTLFGCVARALAYCHANGVCHLDINPSNILLNPCRVYLADFGNSRDISGQQNWTTTNGVLGNEKWRAPELYADYGSSIYLSDIYSLGLVYLNIATVLYNARLADFEDALRYLPRLSLDDRLRARQDKIKRHLEKLTAYALGTPRFILTYEGQETVRPRPIVSLISNMTAPNPRNRLPAERVDEKLSKLGGIYQIYHAECCKRPISWVEDRWDKKFIAMASLEVKHEQQRKRIVELEGRDEMYEARLENARRAHDNHVTRLQALLREAEYQHQRLELDKKAPRKVPRPVMSGVKGPSGATPAGLGLAKSGPTPVVMGPPTEPARRVWSRGLGSRLPLPVTPNRSGTPAVAYGLSITDSSVPPSVFSGHSIEKNVDLELEDEDVWTPISSLASEQGHEQIVGLLLEKGVAPDSRNKDSKDKDSRDTNSKNKDGWTPLSLAAEQEHEEIVRPLLGKGVDGPTSSDDLKDKEPMGRKDGKRSLLDRRIDTIEVDREFDAHETELGLQLSLELCQLHMQLRRRFMERLWHFYLTSG